MRQRLAYSLSSDGELPPEFGAFRAWTGRYLVAAGPVAQHALEAEGLALAEQRRVALRQLIARDPRAALAGTVPAALRPQLPAAVVAQLETRFSVIGDLSVVVFDYDSPERIRRQQRGLADDSVQSFVSWHGGPAYRAYVYGRREGQTTKLGMPLHGILLDGAVALHESAVRAFEPTETVDAAQTLTDVPADSAAISPAEATVAEIGGKLYRFASAAALLAAEEKLAAAESGIGPDRVPAVAALVLGQATPAVALSDTSWTVGPKKILYLRVDFSDRPGEPVSLLTSDVYTASYVQNFADTKISPFYAQSSYGATTMTNTVGAKLYRMPQSSVTYALGGLNDQLQVDARAAAAADFSLASFDRVIVVFSYLGGIPGSQITYGGAADLGGGRLWVNGSLDFRVVAHELGHSFGLNHANLWFVTDGNPVSPSGINREYNDGFDVMGFGSFDDSGDFNARYKSLLGWLSESQVRTITTSGTYRISRLDNATGAGTLALKIRRDATRDTWVSIRRKFPQFPAMHHGAYVIWGYASNQSTQLLDLATPGTDVTDSALALGATFTNPVGSFSLRALAEGGAAPNEYLDVEVTFGVNGAPVVATPPGSQGVSLGGGLALSAVATGTAPLQYQWRKNGLDLAGATNASYTVSSATASTAGAYTVRVVNPLGEIESPPAFVAINAAPVIALQPANVVTAAGLATKFNVEVRGFPAPTSYQWRKAGTPIAGATADTLVLSSAQAGDSGNYDVVVTNSVGTTTSASAALVVKPASTPPGNDNFVNAWTLPGDAGVAQGTTAGATAEVGEPVHFGSPSATASSVWYRWTPSVTGRAELAVVDRGIAAAFAVYTGSSLGSLSPVLTRAGSYGNADRDAIFVVAGTTYYIATGNFYAQTSSVLTLTYRIPPLPGVIRQPDNFTGQVGAQSFFQVDAVGAPAPTYLWERRVAGSAVFSKVATAAPYSGGDSEFLSISPTTAAMNGDQFRCRVIFSDGSTETSRTVTLSLDSPPVFVSGNSATFFELAGGSFTVLANGTPTPTFSVAAGALPSWARLNSTTGVLTGTPPDPAGSPFTFTITAGNGIIPAATQVFTLNVQLLPGAPIITAQPVAQAAVVGSTATFSVTATGLPAATYLWQRQRSGATGFEYLIDDGTYSGATSAALKISPVTGAMAGDKFRCDVTSGIGASKTVTSLAAGLSISVPPLFTSGNTTSFTTLQPGTFSVSATGSPVPTFAVTAGALPAWASLNATTGALTGTPPDATGSPFTFTLTASNGAAPSATQSFTLTVLPLAVKPLIAVQPVNLVATAGQPASLSVTALSSGSITYQWRRNGLALTGATGATYTLASASRTDADFYDVVATAGAESTASQTVRLSVAPTAYPGLVAADPAWSLQPEVAVPGAPVAFAVAPLGDGRSYLAGPFTSVDGSRRTGLVRLKADGTVDPTFAPPEIDSLVRALAVQSDGKLVIGGDFTRLGAYARRALARLNADGSVDPTFNTGAGSDVIVRTLTVQTDGKILLGGFFTGFAGTTRDSLVRLNSDGSVDAGFLTRGVAGAVVALALQADGKIVLGGSFGLVYDASGNVTGRNRLARLNADGTLDPAFTPSADGNVQALAVQASDGKIVVAGRFTNLNGAAAGYIGRLNANGTNDAAFTTATGSGFDFVVDAVVLQSDGKIVVGGEFSTFAGAAGQGLVRLTSTGARDTGYLTRGVNDAVLAVGLLPNGQIIAAGYFGAYLNSTGASTNRTRFARLNADGTLDSGINLALRSEGSVAAVAPLPGGATLVAGQFSHLRGVAVPAHVARILANGSVDVTFNSGGLGANDRIFAALRQPDGKLVIAGDFSTYNGTTRSRLARLNADGTLDASFTVGAGLDDRATTLALLPGGKILLGGSFTTVRGVARNRVAVLNSDGTLDSSFDPGTGPNDVVYSAAVQADGRMVLCGEFTTYAGVAANRLVRLNANGTLDSTFTTTSAANARIYALAVQADGRLVVGGDFTGYDGAGRGGVARINANGSLDSTFAPPAIGGVRSLLVQEDRRVLVHGSFASVGGAPATAYLARLNTDGSRDTAFAAAGLTAANGFPSILSLRDSGQLLVSLDGAFALTSTLPAALPAISVQPLAQSATAGTNVTLSVTATSTLPLTYQWKFNGADLSGQTAAALSLTNVQLANAGNYTVIVANELGATTSAVATLAVGIAPAITAQPFAQTVNAGATATFTVAAFGTPAPTYQWQRQAAGTTGFVNLANGGSYAGVTTAALAVNATAVVMRGDLFQCVVSNGVGSPATSVAVALTVNAPPVFTSVAGTTFNTTVLGSFTVAASGAPAPVFSVTAGALPPWATLQATTGVLSGTPPNTVGSPFSFTLTASNGVAPAATQSFTLTVVPLPVAPVITSAPVGQSLPVGGTITLTVVATGTPPPSYQWRRNGTLIPAETNATFTKPNAQLADAGSYTVVLANTVGTIASAAVTVSVVPAGISAQHVVARSGYTVGGTVTVVNRLTYVGSTTGFNWQVLLPAGWTFASSSNDTGATKPTVGAGSLAEWNWATVPASPFTFTYTLNVPAGTTGAVALVASANLVQSGTSIPLLAQPDPLLLGNAADKHSADTDGDNVISLFELTRVIELYNARIGTTRTGRYLVATTFTEDGFAVDTTNSTAALTRYHSADYNRDGRLSLNELTRVIELYNTRSGTTRTGAYHAQAGTEDGFAPGP